MLLGYGGDIGVATGHDAMFIVDDQLTCPIAVAAVSGTSSALTAAPHIMASGAFRDCVEAPCPAELRQTGRSRRPARR